MQTSFVQPYLPPSNFFAKEAAANAGEPNFAAAITVHHDTTPIFVDPDNWNWSAESRSVWESAEEPWQQLNSRWYGATATEFASPLDPKSQFPSFEPLAPYFHGRSLTSILVRESYVKMFDVVWARAMSSQGTTGVIITGSPGIGVYLLSYVHYCNMINCV